jgi:hypothetical protein
LAPAKLLPSSKIPENCFFNEETDVMLRSERRSKVLAKLTNARCEVEDALKLSIRVERNDSVLMPEPTRNKLSAMIDDLNAVLLQIEGSR